MSYADKDRATLRFSTSRWEFSTVGFLCFLGVVESLRASAKVEGSFLGRLGGGREIINSILVKMTSKHIFVSISCTLRIIGPSKAWLF